jgi:hypothetical protein
MTYGLFHLNYQKTNFFWECPRKYNFQQAKCFLLNRKKKFSSLNSSIIPGDHHKGDNFSLRGLKIFLLRKLILASRTHIEAFRERPRK